MSNGSPCTHQAVIVIHYGIPQIRRTYAHITPEKSDLGFSTGLQGNMHSA